MPTVVISILEVLVEQVGVPLLLKYLASKSPEDATRAILDAEYAALRLSAEQAGIAIIEGA